MGGFILSAAALSDRLGAAATIADSTAHGGPLAAQGAFHQKPRTNVQDSISEAIEIRMASGGSAAAFAASTQENDSTRTDGVP